MIYFLDGTMLERKMLKKEEVLGARPCIGFLAREEVAEWSPHLGIPDSILLHCLTDQTSAFESHEGLDYINLLIPCKDALESKPYRMAICFKKNLLLFLCQETREYDLLRSFIAEIEGAAIKDLDLERVFYEFFDRLTAQDALFLEDFEQEICALEESFLSSTQVDCGREIIQLRKKMRILKRYYEHLFFISQSMEENENGLLSEQTMRHFHRLTARVNRLSSSITHLRDYISQVREAYQAQVEINQNSIMKLFTVITAVFLPPSLIVGWYGMNFSMPEYKWSYGYPIVITLSLLVAIFSLFYFRRNKWF